MAQAREQDEGGGALLMRISNEMVQTQKQFFGKGPVRARSYFFDDLLLVVMRGGFTTAEKTMLEFGQEEKVRDFRQVWQDEMTERLTKMIAELTGRKVVNYQSQVMFDPDIAIEIFFFDDRPDEELIEATAAGQLEDEPVGEVTTDEDQAASGQKQEDGEDE